MEPRDLLAPRARVRTRRLRASSSFLLALTAMVQTKTRDADDCAACLDHAVGAGSIRRRVVADGARIGANNGGGDGITYLGAGG